MIREVSIVIYLTIFRILFSICKWGRHQDKTTFVTYFGCNASYVAKALEEKTNQDIIIITNKSTFVSFRESEQVKVIQMRPLRIWRWIRFVYHVATSKTVMVDNYYGFLAASPFKKGTRCVQLWHAAGAIKKFGFEDESVKKRSKGAVRRFRKVYSQFTHIVVGSDEMSEIFQRSFQLEATRMIKTGIPRTDLFFNQQEQDEIKEKLYGVFPVLRDKKVILYAPTFRDAKNNDQDFPLDAEKLLNILGSDYVIMIKSHPSAEFETPANFGQSIIDVSKYKDVNHLLLLTDILITDYSSIPFEYSLLEKPMIFYAYDLDTYMQTRGIQGDYERIVPGPVARTTDEVLHHIQTYKDIAAIRTYKEKWNMYSTGRSAYKLIEALYKKTGNQ